jgi:hypothetical protein
MQSEALRRFIEHRESIVKPSAPMPVANLKQTKKEHSNLTMATIIEKKPATPEVIEFFRNMVDNMVKQEEEENLQS